MKNHLSYYSLLLIICLLINSTTSFAQGKEDDGTQKASKTKKEKVATTTTTASDKPVTENTTSTEKAKKEKAPKSKSTATVTEAKVDKVNDVELSKLKWKKKRKLGDLSMAKSYYFDAVDYYQSSLSDKPKKYKLLWRLAEANLYSRNYTAAANYYNQLSQTKKGLKKFPITKYKQGIALKEAGNYTAAKDTLNSFVNQFSKVDAVLALKRFARKEIAGIEMLDTLALRKPMFRMVPIGAAINSGYEEFAPFIKGNKMYYTGRITDNMNDLRQNKAKKSYYTLFESSNNVSDWTFGVPNLEPISKQMADVKDAYISPDGKFMYYTRTAEGLKGVVQSKIFVSENDGNGWGVGRPLNENINDVTSNSKQPMITTTADGKEVLYFASNRITGKGGYDIYYAVKGETGEFGRPKSAGGTINTSGDEVTPFFENSTNTLYFSSNGHLGLGGYDVYSATLNTDGTEWSEASHLGVEVNTSADDYYFRPNVTNGIAYMASNRLGGQAVKCATCTDDIYMVKLLKGNVIVMGTVNEEVNGISSSSKDAVVELYNADNNIKIGETTVTEGRFSFDVEKENNNIYLSSVKKDFEPAKVTLNIGDYKEESMITNLTLKRNFTYVGTKIGTVFFDYDQFRLKPDAPDTLNKVVAFMKQFPNYVVQIGGHTDDIGPDVYNDSLSQKRANAVARYILSKDIDNSIVSVKAFGKTSPIAPNKTPDGKDNPDGRALNRRVEFIVIGEKK
ncbi:MAG: OmpA family protein [Bacteroidota bacterium]